MNEDEEINVTCKKHGYQPGAFVCDHVLQGTGKGFCEPPPSELEPDQAWCDDCDKILEHHGEWNEEAANFANFRVVCAVCFKQVKARQTLHLV